MLVVGGRDHVYACAVLQHHILRMRQHHITFVRVRMRVCVNLAHFWSAPHHSTVPAFTLLAAVTFVISIFYLISWRRGGFVPDCFPAFWLIPHGAVTFSSSLDFPFRILFFLCIAKRLLFFRIRVFIGWRETDISVVMLDHHHEVLDEHDDEHTGCDHELRYGKRRGDAPCFQQFRHAFLDFR